MNAAHSERGMNRRLGVLLFFLRSNLPMPYSGEQGDADLDPTTLSHVSLNEPTHFLRMNLF